jgi:pyruvate-formate lyase-activating enzyme
VIHPDALPSLVFADLQGNISDFSSLSMAGMSGGQFFQPSREDLIPLPEGSELFVLPGRFPVGYDKITGDPLLLEEDPYQPGNSIQAVAAFMSPAHTAILNSAYQTQNSKAPRLPLFAYTAVGWHEGRFWVAAFRSDPDKRQDACQFDQATIIRKTRKKLKENSNNRLIQHLGKCCLTYGCPAARNYFLGRWEAPLPTSPVCNARCVGCISLQPAGSCSSTQDRIRFVPTAQEISAVAIPHLQKAEHAIVSFGQGCEGEPLLQATVIEEAIHFIRKKTKRGTINLNSNASLPQAVETLARAGLDSLRVSLNSTQDLFHNRYYRPVGFTLTDVKESIKIMKGANRFVSLNYFIQPGFTDSKEEFEALSHLLEACCPDLIQLRNLNMDPEWYLQTLDFHPTDKPLGMRSWLSLLQKRFPTLRLGYFNPFLNQEY